MPKDLIMGCSYGLPWSELQYWAHSIPMSGFQGDTVIFVYRTDDNTITRLRDMGFRVYDYDPSQIAGGYAYAFGVDENYGHRFQMYYEFLSTLDNFSDYRFVIATDVRDLVFQSNPSAWLDSHLGDKKICASCESLRYRDEFWGDESLRTAFPRLYDRMRARPIWNCGVQAGDIRVMRDFWLQLSMTCAAGLEAADQAAYNVLLSLFPWSEMTLFAMSEHGWACQAGTTVCPDAMASFRPHLLEPEPSWDGTFACTSTGKRHAILHQYDRVPAWCPAIYDRYRLP